MKRNNLLMLAYIIFIFICATVRFLGEFPQWQAIVAAITATSWVFSLADFDYTVANELHEISKDALKFSEFGIKRVQGLLKTAENFLSENKDKGNDELSEMEQEQRILYANTRQRGEACIKSYREIEATAKKSNHTADIAEKGASILTVVGFIGFFSIISFEGISKIFINSQDIMTVMAFGLILFTQYMDEASKKKRKKFQESTNAVNDNWNALKKSFDLEASHYAD